MPKIPTDLHIPGYAPPSAEEVKIQLLTTLTQQMNMLLSLTECVLRATLGHTADDIEQATGLKLVSREEMEDAEARASQDGQPEGE